MERRVQEMDGQGANLKPSLAVNYHEAEVEEALAQAPEEGVAAAMSQRRNDNITQDTEDRIDNGCPTAVLKQQLEDFLLQEATTSPTIPVYPPDSIQTHQDDAQTIVSEVTMRMEDIMAPLYQTPAAALAQVMEDPNDEEVANLFQVQRRTVARPPPTPPPVTTSITSKKSTTNLPLKLPSTISRETLKIVRPSPVPVLPSNQLSKHSEDSGKKQSGSENDPSKKQVGWLEQQQECENGSAVVRDPMSPPPSDNLISEGIRALPQPPELDRSDHVNENHQVPGAHAVPGLRTDSTTVGSARKPGTRSIDSSESESPQEEHAFDAVLRGSREFRDHRIHGPEYRGEGGVIESKSSFRNLNDTDTTIEAGDTKQQQHVDCLTEQQLSHLSEQPGRTTVSTTEDNTMMNNATNNPSSSQSVVANNTDALLVPAETSPRRYSDSIQTLPSAAASGGSVGAHAVAGPGFRGEGGVADIESRTSFRNLNDIDGNSNSPALPASPAGFGRNHHDPFDPHQNLIEATLVEDHPSMPVSSTRPTPEDWVGDDTSNFSLGGQISLMTTETYVEAKPIPQKSRIKPLMLMCLVLAAIVAIVVFVTLSVKSNSSTDDNDNDGSTTMMSTPIIPPSSIDDDTGMNANGTTTTTVYDSTPSSSSSGPTPSPTAIPIPTLQRIRTEGVLRCGVILEKFTNLFANVPGKENTFESDICRAIAAAVMGRDKYKIEIVPGHMAQRVDAIESGEIDVLLAALSWTMDRDVYLPEYQRGLGFSVYTTLSSGFGGIPEFVACAQDGLKYQDECAGMKICTINGTRFYDNLAHQVPRGMLQIVERYQDFFPAFQDGTCNVFASTFIDLNFMTLQLESTPGAGISFSSNQGYFSSEPLGIVTREEDIQWRDFCSYVFQSLFAAEYHNITRDNVLSLQEEDTTSGHPKFRQPTVFGQEYKEMFIDAVATSGNYGEMRTRRVNPIMMSREPINYVSNDTTGIVHSLPFGDTRIEGPSLDERFEDIFSRGKLRCAIKTFDRPGFAQRSGGSSGLESYSGMDVDYCIAIAASMFGPLDTVEFFEVKDDSEGLSLLHRGEVDVVAGVMGDMERDVMDPGTGVGFSFTTPYFYNGTADGTQRGPDANLCLATREDLTGWSEFVFWVVQSTFYAEEQGITRLKANDMPNVEFYGERFTRIFRDAIGAVGSYGEIYERNVEEHVPRGGLNMLHDRSNPTPLFYVSPGIFQ